MNNLPKFMFLISLLGTAWITGCNPSRPASRCVPVRETHYIGNEASPRQPNFQNTRNQPSTVLLGHQIPDRHGQEVAIPTELPREGSIIDCKDCLPSTTSMPVLKEQIISPSSAPIVEMRPDIPPGENLPPLKPIVNTTVIKDEVIVPNKVEPPKLLLPSVPSLPPIPASATTVYQEEGITIRAVKRTAKEPQVEERRLVNSTPSLEASTSPSFSHSEDYRNLTGEVQQWRKGWRLRYARVDEEDRYGGSVNLTGDSQLENLKDGQIIRVTGNLSPQEERGAAPVFRVQSLQVLQR